MLFQPQRSFRAWSGLFSPIELLAKPNLPALQISPGSSDFLRGSEVVVRVEAAERDAVTLYMQTLGDVLQMESSPVRNAQAIFTLHNLNAKTEYWIIASDGTESGRFVLNPIDPLLVADLILKVDFPEYTGRYTEEYRSRIPSLLIPVGSQISIEGMASRRLGSSLLELDQGQDGMSMKINGNAFEGKFYPKQSGVYSWKFVGENGDPAVLFPEPVRITILPDGLPDVEILLPGKDTLLPVSRLQPLMVQSSDDYGIDRLELMVYKANAFGDASNVVVQSIPIGGTKGALVRPVMDLTNWELLPGDTLHYFIQAVDNSPNPNIGKTREYLLLPQSRAEVQRAAQEQLDDVVGRVDELQDRMNNEAQANQDLENETLNDKNDELLTKDEMDVLEFEDQERFREAVHICLEISKQDKYARIIDRLINPSANDLVSEDALDDWLLRYVRTSHHASGTCKMGPVSDIKAVVDNEGRVHGLQSLRVADASIMPDCIRANTNVTTMVIGERIADVIRGVP